jgi:hypothetical protein
MTTKLRAKFDGKVFVPIDPIDLPTGHIFEIDLHDSADQTASSPAFILQLMKSAPHVSKEAADEFERALDEGRLPPTETGIFDGLK